MSRASGPGPGASSGGTRSARSRWDHARPDRCRGRSATAAAAPNPRRPTRAWSSECCSRTCSRAALEEAGAGWGMGAVELAEAAYQVACEDIAAKIRTISVYRGLDVRNFALLAFGAAGPMLADRVGQILGLGTVVVPATPGQFS